MKLKGISLIEPILDVRPLLNFGGSRYWFLSPFLAQQRKTYIKGFGGVFKRLLRVQSRPMETRAFACSRTFTLPNTLPDDTQASKVIRRLYLDTGAAVRLDVSLFDHPLHVRPPSRGTPADWISKFWDYRFDFKRSPGPGYFCPYFYKHFAARFKAATTDPAAPQDDPDLPDTVRPLAPVVIAIALVSASSLPSTSQPLDDRDSIFCSVQSQKVDRLPEPELLRTVHLFVRIGPAELSAESWARLRIARLLPAWLHADAQLLAALSTLNVPSHTANRITSYLASLRERFDVATEIAAAHHLRLEPLKPLYDLELSALEAKLQVAPRAPASLDSRIDTAIETYAGRRLGPAKMLRSGERFADGVESAGARNKAQQVFERLQSHWSSDRPPVILSIGGADGTELLELMKLARSPFGVLLEIDDESAAAAVTAAHRRALNLRVVTGDAAQKVPTAIGLCRDFAGSRGLPIWVTIMAILHELPTRSPAFDLNSFLGSLTVANVVIGREPVEPSLWDRQVYLRGAFTAQRLATLANEIVFPWYCRHKGKSALQRVQVLTQNRVLGNGSLLFETLMKACYAESINYELEECITQYQAQKILDALRRTFPARDGYYVSGKLETSTTVDALFRDYKLEAEATDSDGTIVFTGNPDSHLWFEVIQG